jgi:hypothetical protein
MPIRSAITFSPTPNSTVDTATPLPLVNANITIDGLICPTPKRANASRVFFVLQQYLGFQLTIANGNATADSTVQRSYWRKWLWCWRRNLRQCGHDNHQQCEFCEQHRDWR